MHILLECKNKRSVELLHDVGEYFVPHTETDFSKVKFRTDEMVHASMDILESRSRTEETIELQNEPAALWLYILHWINVDVHCFEEYL